MLLWRRGGPLIPVRAGKIGSLPETPPHFGRIPLKCGRMPVSGGREETMGLKRNGIAAAALALSLLISAAPGRAAADWRSPYPFAAWWCAGAAAMLNVAEDGAMWVFTFTNVYHRNKNANCTDQVKSGASISFWWQLLYETDASGGAVKDCGALEAHGGAANGENKRGSVIHHRTFAKGKYPCFYGNEWAIYELQMGYNVSIPGSATSGILRTNRLKVYRSGAYTEMGYACAGKSILANQLARTRDAQAVLGMMRAGSPSGASSAATTQPNPC